jgi:hypothetical protein
LKNFFKELFGFIVSFVIFLAICIFVGITILFVACALVPLAFACCTGLVTFGLIEIVNDNK